MQLLVVSPATPARELPVEASVCHDVRDPHHPRRILVRKGDRVDAQAVADLLLQGVAEVHLTVPSAGDLDEDHAAAELARVVAGDGVHVGRAHFGQVTLTARRRGLVRIEQDLLARVNAYPGVLVATGLPNCGVKAEAPIAMVKCSPLFLDAATLGAVREVVQAASAVVSVQPFVARRVALVAIEDRLPGNAIDRAAASLERAIVWFGGSLARVYRTSATIESVSATLAQAIASGADLLLAAGAAATDPLDVSFEGLRAAGGRVDGIGIPIEPGTACWYGHLADVPVLGLASCELFGRPGALDLVFPHLFAGEDLTPELVRSLALGGLLVDGPSRLLPYHDDAHGA